MLRVLNLVDRRAVLLVLVVAGVSPLGCQPSNKTIDHSGDKGTQDVAAEDESTTNQRNSGSTDADSVDSSTLRIPSPEELLSVSQPTDSPQSERLDSSLVTMRAERDATVWRMERLAQRHEQAIVGMWDALLKEQRNAQGDPLSVLGGIVLDRIRIGFLGARRDVGWGASQQPFDQTPRWFEAGEWATLVGSLRDAGYRIEQTEWHHATFESDSDSGARSTIRMAIYGVHADRKERYVLGGNLKVVWHPLQSEEETPRVATVDATELRLWSRQGPPPFKEILTIDHATPDTRAGVQPISVYDFNGDGLDEIVVGGANELFWNRGGGSFEKDELLTFPERGFEVSLLADVTSDGIADFVFPGLSGDLLMYQGDPDGRFTTPPIGKARGGGPLRQPQVIAAGDIDNDGDVDLWIGQYKISYVGGQMPTPYYDANDGFPAYLLMNEGGGKFVPKTMEAGLEAKAKRRTYSGSFVDLDNDRDLDLVVASDFAGVDVYLNDGSGRFTDVTEELLDERHLFGMSVTFADYDRNGALDFFATGMASTTARRLDQMGLGRQDRPEIHKMRSVMGYGNRMYLQGEKQQFSQPSYVDQVARTGWSWGSTSFDFDNDGFPDIFVANGHSSGDSTKDHCSHFWCHDIYDATSRPDQEVFHVFQNSMKGYFDRSESWDGYQKNQLLLNKEGDGFVNLGYLMGVGHEYDGRAVISNDVDGDGRLDLLVVEDRWQDGQLLHVYQNHFESDNHWIGVRLADAAGANSVLGATVVMSLSDGSRRTSTVTAGDSIHAQHAPVVHFGLGANTSVESLEVRFVSGKTIPIKNPSIDQYHLVKVN